MEKKVITESERSLVKRLLKNLDLLDEWDIGFVRNINKWDVRMKNGILLSDKQSDKLGDLERKYQLPSGNS